MSNFNIVFRNEIMIINFGELSHGEILNLCDFMEVRQFPTNFFKDLMEDRTDLSFHFTSDEDVIVTMNDVQVYSGDFSESWNTYEYYSYFRSVIKELREGDREMTDDLDELTRDLDYLFLFEEYLDERDELHEQEDRQVDRDIAEANARAELHEQEDRQVDRDIAEANAIAERLDEDHAGTAPLRVA
jgi:hypothetical protein